MQARYNGISHLYTETSMQNLDSITDSLRSGLEHKNSSRETVLRASRDLIRSCANAIKAIHRHQWEEARSALELVRADAHEMIEAVSGYPDLYYAGFTQDALKEYVEAFAMFALARGEDLPGPEDLKVEGATYLNGLCEAASEMRRHVLDTMRHDQLDKADEYLDSMDAIYNSLMTFDFPDALMGGLRRRVDSLRAVIERTRGDLTTSLRQQQLQRAMKSLEQKLGIEGLSLDFDDSVLDLAEADEASDAGA